MSRSTQDILICVYWFKWRAITCQEKAVSHGRGEKSTEVRSLGMFSQDFAILQIYFLQVTKLTGNLMI